MTRHSVLAANSSTTATQQCHATTRSATQKLQQITMTAPPPVQNTLTSPIGQTVYQAPMVTNPGVQQLPNEEQVQMSQQSQQNLVQNQFSYSVPSGAISEELNAAYTLQNMHNAAPSTAVNTSQPEPAAEVDFLTCGTCQKEFLLSEIVQFMRHKKRDCHDDFYKGNAADLYQRLMCQIKNCQQRFSTAWGLLQHVQKSHALNIFMALCQGIENIQVQPQPNQPSLDVNTLLSFGDTLEDLTGPPGRVHTTVQTQTEKPDDDDDDDNEECAEEFCSPEVCAVRKCCDTQNCCITIMPGTHERPKKCCQSVVPKKRKQHMEQHIKPGATTRSRRRKSGDQPPRQDTIYIDFGTPMDDVQTAAQTKFATTDAQFVPQNSYVQVEGTNMFVRNSDGMMVSVDQQNPYQPNFNAEDFTLPDLQNLIMQAMPNLTTDETGDQADTKPAEENETKAKVKPGSRPFKCDHCGMTFNQRIHLKKHLSKHTGIKPFKCGQCNYSTVERSHLKVHIRIHTGEKPFKCSFCEYATAQNSTLKIHLKRHHSGMTLSCTVCGKNFTQPNLLNKHKQEHQSTESLNQNDGQPTGDSNKSASQNQSQTTTMDMTDVNSGGTI